RVHKIATGSGMVTPYNLRNVWRNRAALKTQGGRAVPSEADKHWIGKGFNWMMSTPGVRHFLEPIKATFPRAFDNFINYALVLDFEKNLDAMKKLGWTAFKSREQQAQATGANWQDLTQADNLLTTEEMALWSRT